MLLPTLTDIILVPALSRLIDLGERAEAERLLAAFLRLFLMFALPFAVGALMMGPTILGLLASPEIGIASRWVAPLMAVASIFLGIMRLASLVAFVMGRTRTILGASLVGAGLNIALNVIVLAMIRDIAVPAASALVGYVAAAVYTVLALRPVWRIGFEWGAIARYCIAAAAMGIALRLLGYSPGTVEPVSPFVLAAVLPAGGIAYFAALAAIGGFGRREINQIGNLLRRGDNSAGQAA
jgi:O-antigen/teichoic acid export membrane protein